jgi:hypothetical protein
MTLIFGAAVGLAVTAKFSAIVFLPAAWLVMLVGRFCSRRENPLREFSRLRHYIEHIYSAAAVPTASGITIRSRSPQRLPSRC